MLITDFLYLVITLCSQALLQTAHEVEVKKQKEEEKIQKQLAVNKEDTATEVQMICLALPPSHKSSCNENVDPLLYMMSICVFCRRQP